jgi:hypothetical protein
MGGIAAAALAGERPARTPRDVVKILSFSCPASYASQGQDVVIRAEVVRHGGRFVFAPVPTVEGEDGAKERVFYASRGISEEFSVRIAASLYRASQEMRIMLPDLNAVHVWLQRDLDEASQRHLPRLTQLAQEAEATAALRRAFNLVRLAGVESVPSYIILEAGVVIRAIDLSHTRDGSVTALRQLVLDALISSRNP